MIYMDQKGGGDKTKTSYRVGGRSKECKCTKNQGVSRARPKGLGERAGAGEARQALRRPCWEDPGPPPQSGPVSAGE